MNLQSFGPIIEPVREVFSIPEIKAEIERLQRHSPLVNAVANCARFAHMSDEDFFVVLSYQALRRIYEFESRQLLMAQSIPPMYIQQFPKGGKDAS